MNLKKINTAALTWNEQGTPISRAFDDVYFSNDDGFEETRYVFLKQNQIPDRFNTHADACFVVAETGFGTGLNFLLLWQTFAEFKQQHPEARLKRLHFISFERYPFTPTDLALALQRFPRLKPYAELLLSQWPEAIAGCHRILFSAGEVRLDLWFGDINQSIQDLDPSMDEAVDAWFLDGFAPAKNPEMWEQKLFEIIHRTTALNGTFATFTAAGFVRRGLQQTGFSVQRRKGFGQKREMLAGTRLSSQSPPHSAPKCQSVGSEDKELTLVGGGIASACLALALLLRGFKVTLYCQADAAADNASGNRQAALYPLLTPDSFGLSRFFTTAYTYARRFYDSLPFEFEHQWSGVLQLASDDKNQQKIAKILAMELPTSLVHAVNLAEAEQLAGVGLASPGLYYPSGGWLAAEEVTTRLLAHCQTLGLEICWGQQLISLDRTHQQDWQLNFANGTRQNHRQVVLACGDTLNLFKQSAPLPVYPVAGQISHLQSTPLLQDLKTVLCYEGYLTPLSGHYQTHCLGASYRRNSRDCQISPAEQLDNQKRLIESLPAADWAKALELQPEQARCAVRCASRDHLPMVGALPDFAQLQTRYLKLAQLNSTLEPFPPVPVWPGLFILGALGSRGFCTAPLLAEILAAQLNNEPLPLDKQTLALLKPERQWIRRLLKGRPIQSHHHRN